MGTWIVSNEGGAVTIGADVDIAPACVIATGTHDIGGPERRAGAGRVAPIRIGRGTWVGMRVAILAGAEIGEGSIVAAGSVVLPGAYPRNVLLAGVPARVVRELEAPPAQAETR